MLKNLLIVMLCCIPLAFGAISYLFYFHFEYKRDVYQSEIDDMLNINFELIKLNNEENVIDNYLIIDAVSIPIEFTRFVGFTIKYNNNLTFIRIPMNNCEIVEDNSLDYSIVRLKLNRRRGTIIEFGNPPSLNNIPNQISKSLNAEFYFPTSILRGKHRLFENILLKGKQ